MAKGVQSRSGSLFFPKLAPERGKINRLTRHDLGIPQSRTCMCLTKNSLSEKPNVRSD